MILVIGEILFDVFEKETRLGGAPFNFSYHLINFGFPVRFISRIGKDNLGNKILTLLTAYHFNIDDIQIDDRHDTGTVAVRLSSSGNPTFHIEPDVAYDYIDFLPKEHLSLMNTADVIYFGTLVQRTSQGFKSMQKFMEFRRSDALCFYDINLRRNCYSDKVIFASLDHADLLKLNKEELQECKNMFRFSRNDNAFIPFLMDKYALKMIAVTKGDKGSDLYTETGRFHSETNPVLSIVDTVGAGDAFSAMLAVGTMKGWKPDRTLSMASMFASRICEIRGAIPESREFYNPVKEMMGNGG
jgi:fructokinase